MDKLHPDHPLEKAAKRLAERINGGKWEDPNFYNDEQRALWRAHAGVLGLDTLEHLRSSVVSAGSVEIALHQLMRQRP